MTLLTNAERKIERSVIAHATAKTSVAKNQKFSFYTNITKICPFFDNNNL